jgi:hypothetical protein
MVMRFKAWCDHCGHSAACHEPRHFCSSCVVLLAIAALIAGSLALFGSLGHTPAAPTNFSAVAALQPIND